MSHASMGLKCGLIMKPVEKTVFCFISLWFSSSQLSLTWGWISSPTISTCLYTFIAEFSSSYSDPTTFKPLFSNSSTIYSRLGIARHALTAIFLRIRDKHFRFYSLMSFCHLHWQIVCFNWNSKQLIAFNFRIGSLSGSLEADKSLRNICSCKEEDFISQIHSQDYVPSLNGSRCRHLCLTWLFTHLFSFKSFSSEGKKVCFHLHQMCLLFLDQFN